MASVIRRGPRKDGTYYWAVLYRFGDKQTSTSLPTKAEADKLAATMNAVGVAAALKIYGIEKVETTRHVEQLTVTTWLNHHIDHLTGVEQYTLDKYRSYTDKIIGPQIGHIPLAELTEEHIAGLVKHLETTNTRRGAPRSAKSIHNIHGFLSGALRAAVPKHIPSNPAAGRRLPKETGEERVIAERMLSGESFNTLLESFTEHWRPLIEFLVASGCRWGEAAALRPADVDQAKGTVKIQRAWKHSSKGYTLGTPKTRRSKRTIDVDTDLLGRLDYTHEWLFTNTSGGPVRYYTFLANVWNPAAKKSGLDPRPTPHDLRHTCASWMLNNNIPITVVSRHLGHESIQVTVDMYGDLDRTVSAQAAKVMGKLLTRPSN